jgi:sugar lactone lactonase YvrE
MVHTPRSVGTFVSRLMVGLALLDFARVSSAQGTWSIISLPQKSGELKDPTALAVDGAGNLYIAEHGTNRIQKRDVQGNWSVIATAGGAIGEVVWPHALAADTAGNLYVAEHVTNRIQKRDARGNWSVIATQGSALGQVRFEYPYGYRGALAVDAAGNLYVGDLGNNRVLKYPPNP